MKRAVTGLRAWLLQRLSALVMLAYLVAALLYPNIQPGLHVTFVAGFALMALSVGLHVTFAHGGRQDLVLGRPWQVAVFGVLVLFATVLRTMVNLDPANRNLWIGVSAGVFLIGTVFWLWTVVATTVAPMTGTATEGAARANR